MRRILAGALPVLLAACGGDSPAEVEPAVLKPAEIVTEVNSSWVECSGNCYFQGTARNVGAGCAREVRGVVRFFDGAHIEIGSAAWRPHPLSVAVGVIRPGEVFTYRTTHSVDEQTAADARFFDTEVSWTSVQCG